MCGIAGYFSADPMCLEEGGRIVSRMIGALAHRGPDGDGRHVTARCGLGSTRLAIIDLEHGQMPVFNEDRQVCCVMNGELYTYRDERAGLIGRGHHLHNRSDSEVIPHLYEEVGLELPARLTGMFAVALWDARRQRLLLARDRFGIKPLFVARSRGLVLFASEIKALLATGLVDRRVDARALRDVGSAGYPMPPRTMFSAVESLPPATWQAFTPESTNGPVSYFRVPYPERERDILPSEADAGSADALRELLDHVVADHLVSDVPVGGLVSGGLDSVSVALTASHLGASPLSTFSMVFSDCDAAYDESVYSEMAAAAMRSRHVSVVQEPIDEADYRATIRAMEAPQFSTVPFCEYRLSRAVRDAGLKVVLSGEGADEVFAGYPAFKTSYERRGLSPEQLARRRAAAGAVLDATAFALMAQWWRIEPDTIGRYGLVPPSGDQWWAMAYAWRIATHGPDAPVDALSLADLPDCPPLLACDRLTDPLHRDLLFEQRTRLDGWVLAMSDRVTMAHGVEARVPFLDHRLVELTARVPSRLLLNHPREKHLLREAMIGRVPDLLRTRTKQGFGSPARRWTTRACATSVCSDPTGSDVCSPGHSAARRSTNGRRPGCSMSCSVFRSSWRNSKPCCR